MLIITADGSTISDQFSFSRTKKKSTIIPAAMPQRCFPNDLPVLGAHPDASASDDAHEKPYAILFFPETLSDRFLAAAMSLKHEVVQATWSKPSGKLHRNTSVYTGILGTAFLCYRSYQATGNLHDLHICRDIVHACCAESARIRQCPSFLMGPPGIYALGAAAAKCIGNTHDLNRYVASLAEIGRGTAIISDEKDDISCELLYGLAGYIWAALFVNKLLGYEAISSSILRPILDAIFSIGRKNGSETCQLMYYWHGKAYWGAAHGLAGIVHCLLHFQLQEEDAKAVKSVLRYMINNRFADSKNYPSRKENKDDKLVQWCHGAPGVALTLSKAAEVFQEDDFKEAAVEAGDVVWNRGLLRKVGICHGISGNAYTFLALYRLLGEDRELHRARAFGLFLLNHARDLIASGEMHGGDNPYSLFEGLGGMCYLWLDLVKPELSRFPGYEI